MNCSATSDEMTMDMESHKIGLSVMTGMAIQAHGSIFKWTCGMLHE